MSVTPDDLTPREGKVLRFVVMTDKNGDVVLDPKMTQIRGTVVTNLPRTSIQARHTLWKLVRLGLVRRKLIGHVPTESGKKLLKEADSRHLWLS